MLIKYRIARMQPPGLFGRVLHVTLVTPNTAAAGTTVAAAAGQAWTMLLLVKRLLCLASAFSNLVLASIRGRIIRAGHCRNVDIAFEAV